MNTRHRTRNTSTCTRIISLTALGASASGAFSEVITVDDDGKADFASIQAAVDYASAGDEILVAPGVYTAASGSSIARIWEVGLVLRSTSGPEVTILAPGESQRAFNCLDPLDPGPIEIPPSWGSWG